MPLRGSKSGLPKYVYVQRIGGHTYYRFRRKGGGSVRLPGSPGTQEFHAAYASLLIEGPKDIGRYSPGSVAYTIHLYYQSAKFAQLSDGTKRDYRRYLDRLDRSVGERGIESIDEAYVHQIFDKLKTTPSAANHTVAVMRTLFQFAMKRKIIKSDPTTGIERLPDGDPYERWPVEAIERFRASASPPMRLALDIGLYTGQRLSDVIAMKWSDYDGERIRVVQQKTGAILSIRLHHGLKQAFKKLSRDAETILTSRSGRPFHPRVFSRDFMDARIKAGLPAGYSFHGLRHTAAAILAENGATGPEIQAITGHKSLKLVEHYIRQADQELQADRAIARLPRKITKRGAKNAGK
jgi:Site-specific recombinase XerD